MFYRLNDETLAIPPMSRIKREETIERYNHRADFLGLYKPDWVESTDIKNGDLKWTKENAHQLLSNTLGASKAKDHKEVRKATTNFGVHPWDTKTTLFSIDRPETSHGWDFTCSVSQKLTDQKHELLREKSRVNYEKKCTTLLKDYKNPTLAQKERHVKEREVRRAQKTEKYREHNPSVGAIKVKAKPKTSKEDIALVRELAFHAVPTPAASPEKATDSGIALVHEGGEDERAAELEVAPELEQSLKHVSLEGSKRASPRDTPRDLAAEAQC